jgi:genome maintenance exonuclease 1
VTTVLGVEEKPAIKEWKESLGEEAAEVEIQRCAARGTAFHAIVEKYLRNENIKQPSHLLEMRLFNQTKIKLNHINNIRLQEAALYSNQLKVAGRVDCIADYDGVLSVVDFKTSNNTKTLEMVYDYKLQCTLYTLMFNELYEEVCDNIVIIMAIEKGIASMVFKDKIYKYIIPSLKRINTFYRGFIYEH